jgi:hypothetical protein
MVHHAAAPKAARLLEAGRLCICVQRHGMPDAIEHTQQAPEELTSKVSVPAAASATSPGQFAAKF